MLRKLTLLSLGALAAFASSAEHGGRELLRRSKTQPSESTKARKVKTWTACFAGVNTEEDEGNDNDIDIFQWEANLFSCSADPTTATPIGRAAIFCSYTNGGERYGVCNGNLVVGTANALYYSFTMDRSNVPEDNVFPTRAELIASTGAVGSFGSHKKIASLGFALTPTPLNATFPVQTTVTYKGASWNPFYVGKM